ncbi:MAG: RNB domain-containing ribonuclease [Opitutaceae bacterium]|nr:RNB domain-containing ribonuclease [Opitutaceae bacterium]
MNLRDRLLAVLRGNKHQLQSAAALSRALRLAKNQRKELTRALQHLQTDGRVQRTREGLYRSTAAPRHTELSGRIRFRSGGSAFVILDEAQADGSTEVQIAPAATDVALHGDQVVVQILPKGRTRFAGETAGRVMRVLARNRDTLVGNLRKTGRYWVVTPDDPHFVHDIAVKSPEQTNLKPAPATGDKVVVRLDEWRKRRDPLTGTITTRLGRTHEPRAELLGIFEQYGLAPNFPPAVESEAAAIPGKVQRKDLAGRFDCRNIPTFTIDPDDAKDFDDALSLETLASGETRVGIHIADVSTYVKPGTALDREALRRGNSTYLVGTVIPMLPEKLSNGLCSLVEAEDRLTKVVFLTFGANGRIRETTFANAVIRSRKRLTYKQAYALLFTDDLAQVRALPLPPKHQTGSTGRALSSLSNSELHDLQGWVRKLWSLAAILRRDRMAHGSLDLEMPETKIYVDEKGYADRLERVEHDESHQLIEEFMLAANEAVARLTRTRRLPSLYRVHDDPDEEKLNELREDLATHGIKVGNLSVRAEVVRLLQTLRDHPQGHLLRTQLLRSLRKACYRSSPDGHYGLHKRDYTHFTSPIRRYSDLVVHRVLNAWLSRQDNGAGAKPAAPGYTAAGVENLGAHLSQTETNSQDAERDSVKVKLLEFFERELSKTPRARFAAIITDVRPNGFFVELTESLAFGFVPASVLRDDHYDQTGDGSALIGRRHKRRFPLGGRLEVIVEKVDRFKRMVDFRPAD